MSYLDLLSVYPEYTEHVFCLRRPELLDSLPTSYVDFVLECQFLKYLQGPPPSFTLLQHTIQNEVENVYPETRSGLRLNQDQISEFWQSPWIRPWRRLNEELLGLGIFGAKIALTNIAKDALAKLEAWQAKRSILLKLVSTDYLWDTACEEEHEKRVARLMTALDQPDPQICEVPPADLDCEWGDEEFRLMVLLGKRNCLGRGFVLTAEHQLAERRFLALLTGQSYRLYTSDYWVEAHAMLSKLDETTAEGSDKPELSYVSQSHHKITSICLETPRELGPTEPTSSGKCQLVTATPTAHDPTTQHHDNATMLGLESNTPEGSNKPDDSTVSELHFENNLIRAGYTKRTQTVLGNGSGADQRKRQVELATHEASSNSDTGWDPPSNTKCLSAFRLDWDPGSLQPNTGCDPPWLGLEIELAGWDPPDGDASFDRGGWEPPDSLDRGWDPPGLNWGWDPPGFNCGWDPPSLSRGCGWDPPGYCGWDPPLVSGCC